MENKAVTDMLLNAKWVFAKTMPQFPHEYTLRKNWNNEDFNKVVVFIRENGYEKKWGGKKYLYFDIGNKCYWTMGSPVEKTILINRADI